ncbi:MAG TPA: class I SAM-dependent RNA methyltransferase, partial [Anaerolineae bacterium]|nr:class I SAM-dependent RNA methyltransferase [Anaerolineae bacterium]
MDNITLIATAKFGLEKIVKNEWKALGYSQLAGGEGKVEFRATWQDIPRTNLWLRCVDRALLKMGEFSALTFDELFEQTKAIPWEEVIPADGRFPVSAKTVKSTLRSPRSCQAIVKKAVAARLQAAYGVEWLAETAGTYAIQVSLLRDTAVLSIDTSGAGLHKRGYRAAAGEAPLKETLAAGLVRLSSWRPEQTLLDPLCGSGTILIEAAMIARNIAPGLNRSFAAEEWPVIGPQLWQEARAAAKDAIDRNGRLQINGYDRDAAAIAIAQSNAAKAGVTDDITFERKELKDLWIDRQYGVLISNPPYGRRLAGYREINDIYLTLNKIFRKKKGWAVYILTAD